MTKPKKPQSLITGITAMFITSLCYHRLPCFRIFVHSCKKGCFTHCMTLLLHTFERCLLQSVIIKWSWQNAHKKPKCKSIANETIDWCTRNQCQKGFKDSRKIYCHSHRMFTWGEVVFHKNNRMTSNKIVPNSNKIIQISNK